MGLVRRFSTLLHNKTRSAANRLDDPAAAFDLAYERQLRALQQLRASAAQLVASAKRLEVQAQQLRVRRARLDDQARRALAEGREDQAVDALTEAQPIDARIEDLDARVRQLADLRERLETTGRRMESRVVSMRAQAESLRAQYGAARAAAAAGEAVAGLGPEDGELELLVQQARDKILWTQARADAVGELIERGSLGPGPGGALEASDGRLEAAAAPEKVRVRLAELRAELGAPPDAAEG